MARERSSTGLLLLESTRRSKPPVNCSVSVRMSSFTLNSVAMKITLNMTTAKMAIVIPVRKRFDSG